MKKTQLDQGTEAVRELRLKRERPIYEMIADRRMGKWTKHGVTRSAVE